LIKRLEKVVFMLEIIKVIILGIVQGVTEFLPISSTGHLLITSALLNSEVTSRLAGTFEISIQFGSVIAVALFYRADLLQQVKTVRSDRNVQKFWLNIVIAAIPVAVAGFLFRDLIKETLFPQDNAPMVVATALITVGLVFLLVENRKNIDESKLTDELYKISPLQALLIGMGQMFALIPGVSRSGATVISGLLVGLRRQVAITFAFYLALPVLGGATLIDLLLSLDEIQGQDLLYLVLGMVVSGIVSWFAIGWLLRYIASNTFVGFGIYRVCVGILIFILIAVNVL
jgi:undecaprenyl-diphosphatase